MENLQKLECPIKVFNEWEKLTPKQRNSRLAKKYAKRCGMRSMGEVRMAAWLKQNKYKYEYEPEAWEYRLPVATYTPDFHVIKKGRKKLDTWIEYKGKMVNQTKKILRAVKATYPERDLCLVFERPANKSYKGSKTTYADWAEANGFQWADQIPNENWFK